MNCKLKDCPHNKGQDVSGTCHKACFGKFGVEMRIKGENVKTKRFEVVNDDGQLSAKTIEENLLRGYPFGVGLKIRELPEPSQDVEVELNRLFEKFDHLRCTSPSQPLSNCFKITLSQFVADNKRPEPIKIKSVETGVLMSPAEILGIPTATWMGWSSKNGKTSGAISTYQTEDKNRVVVDISKYPREFYKEIKPEVDYSSIPVGSLIRALCKSNCLSYHGTFVSYRKTINEITIQNGGKSFTFCILEDTIEILSLPEVSK